jgi:hypothetical protein
VRVQAAQEQQLADLGLHRRRGRLGRPGVQPPQTRHPDLRIGDHQPVQLGAAGIGEQVRETVVGFPFGPRSRRGDPLDQHHHARSHHLGGPQMLARQPEQQRGRVVLHRPSQQELLQLLDFQRPRQPPSQVLQHQSQVIGAGLLTLAIPRQRLRVDTQLVGQSPPPPPAGRQ